MSKIKSVFKCYTDPGHGWAAVKLSMLKELGIAKDISSFSYQRGGTVYLEEDCDVSTFSKAYKEKYGIDPVFVEGSYAERSPVRSYDFYRVEA